MLDLAAAAEFDHLALTVDLTWFGNRERDKRQGFTIPPSYSARQMLDGVMAPAWTWDLLSSDPYTYANIDEDVPAEALAAFVNAQLACDFDWDDARWLVGEWKRLRPGGTIALKGVVRPDDAVRARDLGFDCVWVSNHGGRRRGNQPLVRGVLTKLHTSLSRSNRSRFGSFLDESIALLEFSRHSRRARVETVACAHIEVGLKI
jgi:isopentenyl diphosphate isomerase/L-lactate dehydrogenase-like FMN-dependent dehydrogenase